MSQHRTHSALSGHEPAATREPAIRTDLSFDVYGKPHGHPTGDYLYLGRTPGEIAIPAGHMAVLSPRDIASHFDEYRDFWTLRDLDSVYFQDERDQHLLEKFLSAVESIRHAVFDHCGWSIACVTAQSRLEWVEVRHEVSVSDVRCIEHLANLQGLVVVGCNNVFSSGIPRHERLNVLVLRHIASLQNCHQLVETMEDHFPSLRVLHLNSVGFPGNALDLSPLLSLGHLRQLQAVGTRVTDKNGRFASYCSERQEVSEYIDSLTEQSSKADLSWSSVHRDDIEALAKAAPELDTLELSGCHDLNDLSGVRRLPRLGTLNLVNCERITSLVPVTEVPQLRILSVHGCRSISDYACLCTCRTLRKLDIADGAGAVLPVRAYRRQLADLLLKLPNSCNLVADVSDQELQAVIEEVPQYIEAAKAELACLDDGRYQGGSHGQY